MTQFHNTIFSDLLLFYNIFSNDEFSKILYNRLVQILNFDEIEAVAFDIDGTLYRNIAFYLRMFPHFLKHLSFFKKYNEVRKQLHNRDDFTNLYSIQSELLAQKLSCTPEEAKNKIDEIVYIGLKKYFLKINSCKGTLKLICKLKDAGIKIALLSDFPPEQKGDVWGIKQYCDVILSTEEIGALKPSPKPFICLAQKLNVPAEKIFYIGNNHTYDVLGPKKLGMKAGWFVSPLKYFFGCKSKIADITFCKYSQLEKFIFNSTSD